MTRPWHKNTDSPDEYAQWKKWLYKQIPDDSLDDVGEIGLCYLFSVCCELADRKD